MPLTLPALLCFPPEWESPLGHQPGVSMREEGLLSLAGLAHPLLPGWGWGWARFISSHPGAPETANGPDSAGIGVGLAYIVDIGLEFICQHFKIETLHMRFPVLSFSQVIT